jgi:hypothetical protein
MPNILKYPSLASQAPTASGSALPNDSPFQVARPGETATSWEKLVARKDWRHRVRFDFRSFENEHPSASGDHRPAGSMVSGFVGLAVDEHIIADALIDK